MLSYSFYDEKRCDKFVEEVMDWDEDGEDCCYECLSLHKRSCVTDVLIMPKSSLSHEEVLKMVDVLDDLYAKISRNQ